MTLLAGGCAEPLSDRLQSEDPSVRLAAIAEVGKWNLDKAGPYLSLVVEQLGYSEDDVRFYAYLALQKITGQTMGYCYYERPDSPRNVQAVGRWREWLKRRKLPWEGAGKSAPSTTSSPSTTSRSVSSRPAASGPAGSVPAASRPGTSQPKGIGT